MEWPQFWVDLYYSWLYISLLYKGRKASCCCQDVLCPHVSFGEQLQLILLYFRMLDFPGTFSTSFPPSSKPHFSFDSEEKGSVISPSCLFLFWILRISMYGEVREVHNQFTSISSDTRFQFRFRTCWLYTSPQRLVSSPVTPCMAILILIALSYCFVVSKLLFT